MRNLVVMAMLFIFNFSSAQCLTGDCINGHGSISFSWGDKYVGGFKDGVYYGQGTYTFSNGDRYMGSFSDGLRNGQGVYITVSGEKLMGNWLNNQFKGHQREFSFDCISGDCQNGSGERAFKNGDTFKGEFKNGLFNGQG